jgi:hypothetical protein
MVSVFRKTKLKLKYQKAKKKILGAILDLPAK